MNNTKIFLATLAAVLVALLLLVTVNNANAMATTSTSTAVIAPPTGGLVVVQNYRGAPFTWERWLKPVIYISVQAGKTVACVFNPNISEKNTCI